MMFWAKTTADGKPGIGVFEHMVNVGCVARCLAETAPELLRRLNLLASIVGALAALHDLGKLSPGFQRKCEAWLEENSLTITVRNGCWDTGTESDHGKVSHAAIQDFLIQQGVARSCAKYVAAALGGHHGRLKYLPNDRGIRPPLIKQSSENLSGIEWDKERHQCAQQVWDFFKPEAITDSLTGDSPAIWWLAGLTSVADWIGSDEQFFSAVPDTVEQDIPEIALQAIESIGLMPPSITLDLTFKQLFGFSPNEMQTRTLEAVNSPGVYVIEAPMGMGKTEAALGAAYQLLAAGKARGIYFALPTQATSNRIHLRMNDFLQRISPAVGPGRLIHGGSWLMQENMNFRPAANGRKEKFSEDARNGRDWFASAKRALLAPFGVGTVDQALLGVVAAKHFFIRHFALAGKVVILDEVHSYDLYTGTLIDKLITTLEGLGCTVIILSATLTGKRRGQIIEKSGNASEDAEQPYPLISGRMEGTPFAPIGAAAPESRKVTVEFINSEKAMHEALAVARSGGTILWICNTVGVAQKQLRRFQELVQGEFPLGLLHSRFPFWRREELETEWMGRFGKESSTRCGSILVSTQVVEQSVDLDTDLLITELAPTDMLLQRLGRLWRHDRGKRPVDVPRICIIEETIPLDEFRQLTPEKIKKNFGNKSFVYDPYILLRSLEVWQAQSKVAVPAQIRSLIEETYTDRDDEPESWQKLFDEVYGKTLVYRQRALSTSNIWQAALDDHEGVQTRLNELQTVTMVLCRVIAEHSVTFVDTTTVELGGEQFRFATAKAIHKNLVKVPLHHFERVQSCPEFEEYIYETQCAGIVNADGSVSVKGLKEGVRVFYSDDLGLLVEKTSGKEEV
ncbi:CRISPR-associated helicase Cas3' [Pelotalea chapellei]|uniref:CRISPR-associated helicase Cas3 n=1 Tax=Pelotalea chapellei TaxID=44671 RepID=A0ABS5U4Z6_9BACT|nr:CRISPR-associated helicase Cas3' [Pelotalea chapellei]MBT1070732.1 CRISPR-associated helicase Cas3' [Pelotalea chapellei]